MITYQQMTTSQLWREYNYALNEAYGHSYQIEHGSIRYMSKHQELRRMELESAARARGELVLRGYGPGDNQWTVK